MDDSSNSPPNQERTLDSVHSPLHYIPTELVCRILEGAADPGSQPLNPVSVLHLSHIDKYLRSIAIADPVLWSFVAIGFGSRPQIYETFLARSKNSALHIHIFFNPLRELACLGGWDLVFPTAKRWASIHLWSGWKHAYSSDTWVASTTLYTPGPFHLEPAEDLADTLQFRYPENSALTHIEAERLNVQRLSRNAILNRNLECLKLTSSKISITFPSDDIPHYANLTRLGLDMVECLTDTQLQSLHSMICRSTNLEHVILAIWHAPGINDRTPFPEVMELPRLRSLVLTGKDLRLCQAFLQSLHAPRLRHLVLGPGNTAAVVGASLPPWGREELFGQLDSFGWADAGQAGGMALRARAFKDAVSQLHTCTKLTIRVREDQYFQALFPSEHPDDTLPLIPYLAELTLSRWAAEPVEIGDLLSARFEKGLPRLKRLSMHRKDFGTWGEGPSTELVEVVRVLVDHLELYGALDVVESHGTPREDQSEYDPYFIPRWD